MNKRLAPRLPCGPSLLPEEGVPLEAVTRKPSPLTNGIVASCPPPAPQLLARGHDPLPYELMRKPKMDGLSIPESLDSYDFPNQILLILVLLNSLPRKH